MEAVKLSSLIALVILQVYSWGNGDGGRLGHGDSSSREEPTLVQELQGKTMVSIGCGSTYSAAISSQGELYTWGRGNYGRLGHGSSDDHSTPTLVTALKGTVFTDLRSMVAFKCLLMNQSEWMIVLQPYYGKLRLLLT